MRSKQIPLRRVVRKTRPGETADADDAAVRIAAVAQRKVHHATNVQQTHAVAMTPEHVMMLAIAMTPERVMMLAIAKIRGRATTRKRNERPAERENARLAPAPANALSMHNVWKPRNGVRLMRSQAAADHDGAAKRAPPP